MAYAWSMFLHIPVCSSYACVKVNVANFCADFTTLRRQKWITIRQRLCNKCEFYKKKKTKQNKTQQHINEISFKYFHCIQAEWFMDTAVISRWIFRWILLMETFHSVSPIINFYVPIFTLQISRALAAKTALAIRVDALGEDDNAEIGLESRAKLEARCRQLEEGVVSWMIWWANDTVWTYVKKTSLEKPSKCRPTPYQKFFSGNSKDAYIFW